VSLTKTELNIQFQKLAGQGIISLGKNYKPNTKETQIALVRWHKAITIFMRNQTPQQESPILSNLIKRIAVILSRHIKVEEPSRIFLPDSARGEILNLCTDIKNVKKWSGSSLA